MTHVPIDQIRLIYRRNILSNKMEKRGKSYNSYPYCDHKLLEAEIELTLISTAVFTIFFFTYVVKIITYSLLNLEPIVIET